MSSSDATPSWIHAVSVKSSYLSDKFLQTSGGMQLISSANVVRTTMKKTSTDAARWSRGFVSGRHVFEIVYPRSYRGSRASVGVGTAAAPLTAKGRVTLVGHNKLTWGLDLSCRKSYHNNTAIRTFPKGKVALPDKFFMYLDMDSGLLQFGTDERYYGTAVSGIHTDGEPLYPMVASCKNGSSIGMVYRGEGELSVHIEHFNNKYHQQKRWKVYLKL